MSDQPIVDDHVAFARALVALCREHGVGSIHVAHFDLTASTRFFGEGQYNPTRVSMSWSEGRHGDKNRIALRAEASVNLPESTGDGDA